jgi:hypothetical protein
MTAERLIALCEAREGGQMAGDDARLARRRCAFEGCLEFFDGPETLIVPPEGWAHLSGWGPGVADGFYCGRRADALEKLHLSGELGALQARKRGDRRRSPRRRR